jgi:mRNA interferase MazF
MRRGEIRWHRFAAPDKKRPVLLLTRDAVIGMLNELIVAPVTRSIRGLETEVVLSPNDGMPTACAINFDHVGIVHRSRLGALLCTLPEHRWAEAECALLAACGFTGSPPALDRS